MKLRNPGLIKFAGLLGAWTVRSLMSTIRIREASLGEDPRPDKVGKQRLIYAFWHDSLLYLAGRYGHHRNVSILISHHADGELIAQACKSLGTNTIRGSTSKGGTQGLLEMIQKGETEHLAITPDGPRGPRHRVQLGVIYLASRTQMPIMPFGSHYKNAWYTKGWDRMGIPKPYSQAAGVAGKLLHVPPDLQKADLESYRVELENRMEEADAKAKEWVGRTKW